VAADRKTCLSTAEKMFRRSEFATKKKKEIPFPKRRKRKISLSMKMIEKHAHSRVKPTNEENFFCFSSALSLRRSLTMHGRVRTKSAVVFFEMQYCFRCAD
jgi:hypothetical protein